jgi:GT2 family glycosyltransferase
MISVVVVTCNRPHLLRKCVGNVLARVSELTKQIIVWDNSEDAETKAVLAQLPSDRFTITGCGENIGVNAYARAFKLANQPYFIELDDDVIDAPAEWDAKLLAGYKNLDRAGYLAADMVNDPDSSCAHCRWYDELHKYTTEMIHGQTYHWGPVGGWCSMTSREVYDRVGGFKQNPRLKFWREDGDYINRVKAIGGRCAIYGDLLVHHASGSKYAPDAAVDAAKEKFYSAHFRSLDRRRRFRDTLIGLPIVGPRLFARRSSSK